MESLRSSHLQENNCVSRPHKCRGTHPASTQRTAEDSRQHARRHKSVSTRTVQRNMEPVGTRCTIKPRLRSLPSNEHARTIEPQRKLSSLAGFLNDNGYCNIVRFYSKGNPPQVCFRTCHVLVMQRLLFKNQLDELHFSYKKTFFLQGTLDGLPFE